MDTTLTEKLTSQIHFVISTRFMHYWKHTFQEWINKETSNQKNILFAVLWNLKLVIWSYNPFVIATACVAWICQLYLYVCHFIVNN